MSDITKCKSENCPLNKRCYRYTSKADSYQSYFVDENLYKNEACEYFWDDLPYYLLEDFEKLMEKDNV